MWRVVAIAVSEMADRLVGQLSAPKARTVKGPRAGDSPHPAGSANPADEEWHKLVHFLELARHEGFDLSEQAAVVEDRGQIQWAVLGVRSPGRTSLMILGPLPDHWPAARAEDTETRGRRDAETGERSAPVMVTVSPCPRVPASSSPPAPRPASPFHQAVALLADLERGRDVGLLQALLSPAQAAEARLLSECGLSRLAELIYMQGELPVPAGVLSARDPADAWPAQLGDCEQTYTERNAPDFVRVIQASYVHTLDCPALEGVRRMDDVLAGHRASGVFRPDLWFLFCRLAEPLGVVLLNEVLDSSGAAVELVYMGLVEGARGQGLGRRMFHFAMRAARKAGYRRIFTAVDAQNEPALRLYRRAGLSETMRRVAFILPLSK